MPTRADQICAAADQVCTAADQRGPPGADTIRCNATARSPASPQPGCSLRPQTWPPSLSISLSTFALPPCLQLSLSTSLSFSSTLSVCLSVSVCLSLSVSLSLLRPWLDLPSRHPGLQDTLSTPFRRGRCRSGNSRPTTNEQRPIRFRSRRRAYAPRGARVGPTKRRRILPTWLMLSRSCCVQSWFVDANSGNKFPVVTAPPVKVVPGDQITSFMTYVQRSQPKRELFLFQKTGTLTLPSKSSKLLKKL